MAQILGQPEVVLAVGSWPAVRPSLDPVSVERTWLKVNRTTIRFALPGLRHIQRAIANLRPTWLLIGDDLDDESIAALTTAGRELSPDLRTAMLGPHDDVERCLRWTRRGCSVYLVNTATAERVVRCVRLSWSFQLVVIDECFCDVARHPHIEPLRTPRRSGRGTT